MIRFSECIMLPIEKAHPAPYNPRVELSADDPMMVNLRDSILKNRIVAASVWNKQTGNIVGGNKRLMVYHLLKMERIPVNVVDLPLEDEMTLNIALNRISGEFDAAKYSIALHRIATAGLDIIKTGASMEEMTALAGSFDFSSVPALDAMTYNPPVHAMYKCPCCGFTDVRKRFKKV